MGLGIIVASEIHSLIQRTHLAIFDIPLVACAVAIDEEEPIPVVEVDIILGDVIVVPINEIRSIRSPVICDIRICGPKICGGSVRTVLQDSFW